MFEMLSATTRCQYSWVRGTTWRVTPRPLQTCTRGEGLGYYRAGDPAKAMYNSRSEALSGDFVVLCWLCQAKYERS